MITTHERSVATVMRFLISYPHVGRDNTIEGIVAHIYVGDVLPVRWDNDERLGKADWNTVFQVVKEADERLRGKHSAKEYYEHLITGEL